jgi:hypothetical protein
MWACQALTSIPGHRAGAGVRAETGDRVVVRHEHRVSRPGGASEGLPPYQTRPKARACETWWLARRTHLWRPRAPPWADAGVRTDGLAAVTASTPARANRRAWWSPSLQAIRHQSARPPRHTTKKSGPGEPAQATHVSMDTPSLA